MSKPDRSILFIDGNNFFHGLEELRVPTRMRLDYAKISEKLVGAARQWLGTRYYIGALKQAWNPQHYADQRRFLSLIQQDDTRITAHMGRMEERPVANPLADELHAFLESSEANSLPRGASERLRSMALRHRNVTTLKEKAVDVMLAVDMFRLAQADEYDAAYLLSADGDYTPPVEAVCAMGKKVYVAPPASLFSSALNRCCTAYIKLELDWFDDCYR